MGERGIPPAVISRLPRYYRFLGELIDRKVERISSRELSLQMHLTASQIRQDLNHFGGFGQQGYGYNAKYLHTEIGKILGLDRSYKVIVVGAGRLGKALADYVLYEKRGYMIVAMFDKDPAVIGQKSGRGIAAQDVASLARYLEENEVDIAALTLPSEGALEVMPILLEGGIRGIWNFSHTVFPNSGSVAVQNVHLSESLMELTYRMNHLSI